MKLWVKLNFGAYICYFILNNQFNHVFVVPKRTVVLLKTYILLWLKKSKNASQLRGL